MTFYFIAGEPSSLIAMANIAHIIKKIDPGHAVKAVVPYHTLLAKMDAKEFLDEFDQVRRLPVCDFEKNIFRGLLRGRAFKKAMEGIVFDKDSVVFAFISMEMSINLLIRYVNERYKTARVILLCYTQKEFDITEVGGKFDWRRTFLNKFYSFMLGCYSMKSYRAANGQLMYREYCQSFSFSRIVLSVNHIGRDPDEGQLKSGQHISLPYPTVMRYKQPAKKQKKFVVFFGDATMANFYTQLDKQFLVNKTTQYVNAIHDYYAAKNIRVYYKPHPYDGEKIMEGCETAGFVFFKERINAEMLFSKYRDDIVAVYTVSSHSVVFGSENGIPAYWAHEVCFNDEKLKESFRKVTSGDRNTLLKSLISLDQIGCIDGNRREIDMNKILKAWEFGLQALVARIQGGM